MAKARKQKGDGASTGGGATVLHQKLCLSIDMENQLIYGLTIPLIGKMKVINRIVEEGIENSAVEEGKEKENDKEKEEENGNEKSKETGNETEYEKVKNIKLVHIDYILEKAETGVQFVGNVMRSSSQTRRAHCWFPCVDSATERCPFDLEFTVSMDFIAVSNGDLLYQANCSVCESDVSGATALSSTAASSDLYGTQAIGSYGKVRSLKAVAVFKCWRSRWDQTHFGRLLLIDFNCSQFQILQGMSFLASLLKQIDRFLQFDNFMPGYNGVLTVSCIRTLVRIAKKVPSFVCLDHIFELVAPFRNMDKPWKVRIEASRILIDLELHHKGLDAALLLFLKYVDEEKSLRGWIARVLFDGFVCFAIF
ncbi:Transcription initiation factor TFIID subunit 2 [Zea mays]|uniref:Transcription initiation factor TFIID subunit 2 n=1 Tax=Zea mays TaxID=4577 RepID=A0A1D6EPP6_MAIZE|nr:Transcription initiation factor TFIID subunit 2 [Zea mays]